MTYWGRTRDANFWIENASVEWNEAEAPFHVIARLALRRNSQQEHTPTFATRTWAGKVVSIGFTGTYTR
jgi:hypothetical protein